MGNSDDILRLEPCIKCGSDELKLYRYAMLYYVKCKNCGWRSGPTDSLNEAIDIWNMRF